MMFLLLLLPQWLFLAFEGSHLGLGRHGTDTGSGLDIRSGLGQHGTNTGSRLNIGSGFDLHDTEEDSVNMVPILEAHYRLDRHGTETGSGLVRFGFKRIPFV